jgi:tripartite-type tricarboxylate transporter receptor subunit TctC
MQELAKTDRERAALLFYSSLSALGRAITLGPDTPPERHTALRAAFDAVMKYPEFLAEAARQRPMSADVR